MTRVFTAAATALFLGAVITEIHSRLFPGRYFTLLVLSVVAIFVGALVTNKVTNSATSRVTNRVGSQSDESGDTAFDGARTDFPADTDADDDRETGRVKWFNRTKGFGFIVRDSGGEIFVHHRNIRGSGRHSLKDGEFVRFKVATHDKGLQAEQVSVTQES